MARQSHVSSSRLASDMPRQRDVCGVATPLVTSRDLDLREYKGRRWVPGCTSSCWKTHSAVPRFFVQQHLHSTLHSTIRLPRHVFINPLHFTSAIMFATPAGNKLLYTGAAAYATCTAFAAFWVGVRLPVQHNKAGPFNYHKIVKAGRRVPWRRLPRAL